MFRRIVNIERREWPKVFLMFSYFFLVITVFQILKPMKKGLFLDVLGQEAAEWELVAKLANILLAAIAMAVFSFASEHLRRDRLVAFFGVLFMVAFVAYGRSLVLSQGPGLVWSFYLFGDLFATLMVVLFWAFLNDISAPDQAKRIYGLIGAGGVIGGFVGNTIVRGMIRDWGTETLLYVNAGMTALMIGIAYSVHLLHERGEGENRPASTSAGLLGKKRVGGTASSRWSQALEGMRLVFRSRYLLAIIGIISLYEMTSTILDYQYSATVVHFVQGVTDKQVFLATVGQVTGIVSIVVQVLLTSFVLTQFGVGVALLILPVAILLSSIGFLLVPTLLAAAGLSVSDNGLSYSINQTSKEVLYTPTTREEKYKAKAFIDMFVQRLAKGIAVGLSLLASATVGFAGVRFLSLLVLSILVCWILVARFASLEFRAREEAHLQEEGILSRGGQ